MTYYGLSRKLWQANTIDKKKLSTIKTNTKIIQVLTLAPETWSIKKVGNFFNVTEYVARKATSLVHEKGNLALPDKKREKTYQKIQLTWLKHSLKKMNFLKKSLEKKIMLVFPAIPTNRCD